MGEEEIIDFVKNVFIRVFEDDVHGVRGERRCKRR